MVIGAGVAGLSAVGTASSMGAIVRAFDTRPEVKDQVESLGAEFLEFEYEEEEDPYDAIPDFVKQVRKTLSLAVE